MPTLQKNYLLTAALLAVAVPSWAGIYKKGFGSVWSGHHLGATLELDLSKTYLSGYVDFAKRTPIKKSLDENFDFKKEARFYLGQLQKTLQPKYFLLEWDFFPLTNLGVMVKKSHPSLYKNAEIPFRQSYINPFELIASRFEQPYSVSIFIGEIFPFFNPSSPPPHPMPTKKLEATPAPSAEEKSSQSGSALMGHVLTYGPKSIIKLVDQDDHWFQYSFKLKGNNQTEWSKKKWMFELGYVHHQNPQFFKAILLQIIRDWASKKDPSFWNNIKIEYMMNVPVESFRQGRELEKFTSFQKIVFGRNYYFQSFILGMEVGVKWELFKTANKETFSETSFILAPNISW